MPVMPADELTCIEIVELVTAYIEDTLPFEARRRFDAHLTGCDLCTEYLRQMRLTIHALGRLPEESISGEALAELQRAFRSFKA
jgi:anti-sigma factor RsiW